MSVQKLHGYVLGMVGLFVVISATFPLAMMRISQHEKFDGQTVKSFNCEGKVAKNPVYWWQHCRLGESSVSSDKL